jgi:hypothetical protein
MRPSNSTEKTLREIQHHDVQVVRRGSKFTEMWIQDGNSEGNNVVPTTSPFTRYSTKKYSVDIDENKLNIVPSTTSRGKFRGNTYQVRNFLLSD